MTTATANSAQEREPRVLDIVSLYPNDMNIYGDSGNMLTIMRRAKLYGYEPVLHAYNQGDAWPERVDMVIGGGGQDKGQSAIQDDLYMRANTLRTLAEEGVPMLMICGLYQLFGDYFETAQGERIRGIGILGVHTTGQDTRMIGNLVERSQEFGDIVGYENHSGQTVLDGGVEPLGQVEHAGMGNNGQDHTEGARVHNVIGTYMHGSLLPKNPRIADFLIGQAARRRYGEFRPLSDATAKRELEQLNTIAEQARQVAMKRPR